MKKNLIVYVFLTFIVIASSGAQTKKVKNGILGADISFLPELEARGRKFYDKGVEKDAMEILKDYGFNYIRLRVFNDPAAPKGYSPGKGFCDLEHTKIMARRIKALGLKFLLDFHYSDTWADPGKQFKPAKWTDLSFPALNDSVRYFTKRVLTELKEQGTLPDMVQVGNEINHGMLWPTGKNNNMDSLATLVKSGIAGIKEVSSKPKIMIHIACGGQNEESIKFIDAFLERGVKFDIIGQSYYPEWHGTIMDLKNNLTDLTKRYKQDVIVVEYSQKKREVNDVAFQLPGKKIKGTMIWEPLSWGETVFDKDGNPNTFLSTYSDISKLYLK